jgi:3-hydroxybutyryl-CoA dehydrogenase
MKIILLCNAQQKEELITQDADPLHELIFAGNLVSENMGSADACIDLLFDNSVERVSKISQLQAKMIVVNFVEGVLNELPGSFIRINGWNTFLKRPVIEATGPAEVRTNIEQLFAIFSKKIEWVTDIPGFVAARVIASIINEAYFALQENVSTKKEIDTAMKLGTNYPYGPFEWGEKIGLKNVVHLLNRLSVQQKRYSPAELLVLEANQ